MLWRWTRAGLVGLWVWAAALLCSEAARAEPYIAVREGMRCSACHTNVTGGGKRTDLVSTHAKDLLHYPDFLGPFSRPVEFFTGEINPYVALGGDLRTSASWIFQSLGATGRVRNDRAFRGRLEQTRLEVTQATVYGELRLIPDRVTFYIDQRFQPTVDTREAFALVKGFLPWDGFIKVGRMFLPYGLQLQDDEAFIRGGRSRGSSSASTGFSFNLQEPGALIGFEPGKWSLLFSVTDGSAGDRDVRTVGTIYTVYDDVPVVRTLLLGGSASRVAPPSGETVVFGFFAGTNLGPLTLLGEVDFRSDKGRATLGRRVGQFLAYGEADYLLFGWLNIKAAVDYADSDGRLTRQVGSATILDTANDAENRVSIGLEPFLNRFVQPRLFYRINNGIRSDPTHNQNVLLLEAHVFF
ncbi:MAG: hypothetical protein KatS3mg077_2516 [Candidatus Binatia bacterium]|nr:MAG: hypothetical protein KatS3mg077_2516 [Candidatus Binatia bacterium]